MDDRDTDFGKHTKILHDEFCFISAKGAGTVMADNVHNSSSCSEANSVEEQLEEILKPEFITRIGLNNKNQHQRLPSNYETLD